jgi:hypothetical protein
MRHGQRRKWELLTRIVAVPWNRHRSGHGNRRVHEKAAIERDNSIALGINVKWEAVQCPAAKWLDIQVGKATIRPR